MPCSHKRRAVLRTVTRQFRHLTLRVRQGFSRLTSMQCLCLRPCPPQRALLARRPDRAPTRSPVHSSPGIPRCLFLPMAFAALPEPSRPTFPTALRFDQLLHLLTTDMQYCASLRNQLVPRGRCTAICRVQSTWLSSCPVIAGRSIVFVVKNCRRSCGRHCGRGIWWG